MGSTCSLFNDYANFHLAKEPDGLGGAPSGERAVDTRANMSGSAWQHVGRGLDLLLKKPQLAQAPG
jgi:hypothetical protein